MSIKKENNVLIATKYMVHFIGDKIIFLLCLFDKIDEYKRHRDSDEYNVHFLMDNNYRDSYKNELIKLLSNIDCFSINNVSKIYELNSSTAIPIIIRKIEYFIQNKFWSLLNFYEVDTYEWTNKEFYDGILMNKGLRVYYIIGKENSKYIVLASIDRGNLEYIKHWNNIVVPLYKMRRRQVIYDLQKNVCTL